MTRTPRITHAIRTVRIARELHHLTPEAVTVRLTPVTTDRTGRPTLAHVVLILDGHGRPCGTLAAHRVARRAIRRQHTAADWTRSQTYDIRTGRLTAMATLFGAAELGVHEGGPR